MNFVYISPNFPENHWLFCRGLKNDGVSVFGIGDCPYENLTPELKNALTEYYKVSSLENYDEVYRAVAYFAYKHGRIDYLESNNEYWLESDARLRKDFNITTGFLPEDMPQVKCKSRMKAKYIEAGIPVALYHLVDDKAGCLDFIQEVGYPVIVKPDNGVGAIDTLRIQSEADLDAFFSQKDDKQYIMEEYIDGSVVSYDAVVDGNGEPVFEAGNLTIDSIMDIVNERRSCRVMIRAHLPEALRDMGRAAVKAFGVKKRMVHFEFFELSRDQRIGKAGEYAGLEVNMRPCGGILPTMINYAYSTDVYQIWADVLVFGESKKPVGAHQFCVLAGRRNERSYVMTREQVLSEYQEHIFEDSDVDPALAVDMGDYIFLACFPTWDEVLAFYSRVLQER
jgi:hypothetical protein